MTVTELLDRITGAYPGATAEAMKSFKSVFYARLRQHEGDALEEAATAVLGVFKPTMRQPFPIPGDFEAHLPSGKLKLPASGKPLDFKGHRERKHRLMADWRAGQGARAANGVPEVLRALEFVADPIAGLMAWENPEQLLLKRSEVRIAQHRAVSQERRRLHGVPPENAEVFWAQISTIAHHWGIETKIEDWTAKERETVAAPIEPRAPGKPFAPADTPTNRRLAELAAAKREGRTAAEYRDVAEVSHG